MLPAYVLRVHIFTCVYKKLSGCEATGGHHGGVAFAKWGITEAPAAVQAVNPPYSHPIHRRNSPATHRGRPHFHRMWPRDGNLADFATSKSKGAT